MDADEVLLEGLKDEMLQAVEVGAYEGFYIKYRFYFMRKWLKHGGDYPAWILRLFKKGKGIVERDVNEHLKLDGQYGYLKNDFADINRKGIRHESTEPGLGIWDRRSRKVLPRLFAAWNG